MDTEVREWMECAREADAWAGVVADPTLRAQWIEIADGYRTMARNRLEALLNPAGSMPPPVSSQASAPPPAPTVYGPNRRAFLALRVGEIGRNP